MKERLSLKSNRSETGKELADVAIGAGLITAGPELAKFTLGETAEALGTTVPQLPPGGEFIGHLAETGIDTARSFAVPVATAMIMYAGFKKLLSPLSGKK